MKKLTALLLSLVLVLSLAACGSANKPATSTSQPETSAPTEEPTTAPTESASTAPSETEPETGKTLVVYYSASGNTERVAKDIAEAAGADLFEIVPTEVYTSDDLNWTNSDSRVSREHDDESLRDVPLTTTEVPDWDSYDTVFIGFPIWWYVAPTIIDTFLESADFSGKKIIPFATSGGSGMGKTVEVLKKVCPNANWRSGAVLNRMSDSALAEWVEKNDRA
mgnify:CR=1 FL=1